MIRKTRTLHNRSNDLDDLLIVIVINNFSYPGARQSIYNLDDVLGEIFEPILDLIANDNKRKK